MAIYKLRLNFANYSDNDLANFCLVMQSILAVNVFYPITNPTMVAMGVLITNFTNSLLALSTGGQAAEFARDQARIALEAGLRTLVNDLESKSNNDPNKLATTGFQVYDSSVKTYTQPGRPVNLNLEYGTLSGEIIASVTRVPKIAVYLWRYTLDPFGPNARWSEIQLSTTRQITLKGLPRNADIWVQCCTFNTQGYSDWSDPATILVR